MQTTDIPARKAEERRTDCLHCVISAAIEEYYQAHGRRVGDQVAIDVTEVASKLTECIVEVIVSLPGRSDRRRAMRFAHDALDANLKSQMSGKLVAVDIPTEQ